MIVDLILLGVVVLAIWFAIPTSDKPTKKFGEGLLADSDTIEGTQPENTENQ